MDTHTLVTAGLTNLQARAYVELMDKGEITPPELVKKLRITRTNAYKLLDKLVELRLALKEKKDRKLVYAPANPMALASISARYRAKAVAREEAVSMILNNLMSKYYEHSEQPHVEVTTGKKEAVAAYRKQLSLHEDVYFVHTKADVAIMGFDTMHDIRIEPSRHGLKRHGILASVEGPINYKGHERSNLDITWTDKKDYTAPAEWSATKSSLLMVIYDKEPHAIFIANPVIAQAFIQLWTLLSGLLRQQPTHKKLSKNQ
jgi:hypothetical protein